MLLSLLAAALVFLNNPVAGVTRVGTLQSASSPYYLSVFSDPETDTLLAGLHTTMPANAQLWEYDEGTGRLKARGIELFLTAVETDGSIVLSAGSDLILCRWSIELNNHIVLLSNGKSLTFNSPREGMAVRLAYTNELDEKQA